ncbi:flagellar hook-length control protein FliK [Denitrificimonas caeni]|uniref:flagellar hook-length control protein FliK n=1 Tax=Denitrificimonas caeni TaxID=521720 RepID=UPI001E2E39E0|nr:flagellar hook-length control protein FliK [Denitrificimonas caeni]
MASTDFLLRSSAQPSRVQPAVPEKTVSQRSAPAAGPNFSVLYAQQQQTTKIQQQQQQQQQSLQAKQRQEAVQQNKTPAASTPATAPAAVASNTDPSNKNTSATVSQSSVDIEKTETDAKLSDLEQLHTPTDGDSEILESGNYLPQDEASALDAPEEDLLDPLLLMAMAVMPQEPVKDMADVEAAIDTEAAGTAVIATLQSDLEADAKPLLSTIKTHLELSGTAADNAELPVTEDASEIEQKNMTKDATSPAAEKAAGLLNNVSEKIAGEGLEKDVSNKNKIASALEGTKVAPETLLDAKAVTAPESIRTDLQSRPDSLMAAQSVRQVPGAAVAMQQPGWTQDVTDKVMWMSSQNLRSAEIKLDPAELGRLDITVSVNQEHTQITFNSAHAGVRESLEAQMYRLRELFAQQGMQSVDVNVSDQSRQQAQAQTHTAGQGRSGSALESNDEALSPLTSIREQHDGRLGLVDYYA